VKVIDTNTSHSIGGFCGYSIGGVIYNSYSSCTVSATSSSKYENTVASFCNNPDPQNFRFSNCYSTGNVVYSKNRTVYGYQENGTDCFWDIETTGIPDTGGHEAKGLPTSEMKKKATYVNAGWDFDSVWCIDEGKDYPKLRAFGKCPNTVVPQELSRENKFIISPNPVADKITIVFPLEFMSNASISILDMLGNELLTQNTSGNRIEFDCSLLPNGIYFCVVKTSKGTISDKFMVLK
jgi:hypothetical protein